MTTATAGRPPVTILAEIRGVDYTLEDAVNAAAVLAEVSACHEEGAERLACMTGLDALSNEELEALCEAFGVEY
jgi:hypothetical protein